MSPALIFTVGSAERAADGKGGNAPLIRFPDSAFDVQAPFPHAQFDSRRSRS